MNSILCRKSICTVICSIITTICSYAQENNLFKQLIKESFKDLATETLKPKTMLPDSLIRNLKLDLNKDLLFINKQQLTISENLLKPYTNDSKIYPCHTATFSSLTNKITFDNNLPNGGGVGIGNLDFNAILTYLLTGKKIYKKLDFKYTESEKQALIEKTNQIIQESRLETESDCK